MVILQRTPPLPKREHLPGILLKRGVDSTPALETLQSIHSLVLELGSETYRGFESVARERMSNRDQDDWPILAAALALQCPIWTEDTDFFGCGVPTWTTDRVEIYLKQISR